jgi:hypothetical protein
MLRIGQDITAPKVRVGDEPTRLCRLRSANLHGGSTSSSSRGRRLLDCRLGLVVTTVLVEQLKRPPRRFRHTVFRHACSGFGCVSAAKKTKDTSDADQQ